MAPTRSPRARLLHIRDEIVGVADLIDGMDFETYRTSYVATRTVERAIQIVSEAAKALPDDLVARYPEIEWAMIRAIGNFLRHEYHKLDAERLWLVATVELPKLAPVIERMLAEQ